MTHISLSSATATGADPARLRSGTAARLAGVPVATLRVWERRYGVVAAPKTATGQRLYSTHDVQRLRLLKRLTDAGHAIGTIANLPFDALQARLAGEPPEPPAVRQVVVVGRSAANKFKAVAGCALQAVYDDLDDADAAAKVRAAAGSSIASTTSAAVDLLLVHQPSLQPAAAQRLLALGARLQARAIVVLYAFGTDAVLEQLRRAGAAVRREPVSGGDLARLIGQVLMAPETVPAQPAAAPALAPRRFSDAVLAALAEMPSVVACECPRHLAEIALQLAGFERYSAECSSRTPADAALHRHLSGVAGQARAMFEQALARVMVEEGIELPPDAAPV